MLEKMTEYAIIIPDSRDPYVVPYQDELSWLQDKVGGWIEIVQCRQDPSVAMVISDTGKLDELPENYLASVLYGVRGDFIAGPAVLLRRKGPELIGWTKAAADRICADLYSMRQEYYWGRVDLG